MGDSATPVRLVVALALPSLCLALSTPGAAQVSGPARDFFTVAPCRLVDTRLAPGPLGGPALTANTSRAFVVVGHCQIPLYATAVSLNLTVISPLAGGDLRLYASGTPLPSTSSINYAASQTRANNAVVALGADGALVVHVDQPTGTTHLVLDANGYFGTLDCSGAHMPPSPGLTVNTGTRALTWLHVPGATAYNLYLKAVAGECGLLGPQMVTRSDQKFPNVSSPFDVSPFDKCGTCYFVDVTSLSGVCESPLQSDSGAPAPIAFGLLPCTP